MALIRMTISGRRSCDCHRTIHWSRDDRHDRGECCAREELDGAMWVLRRWHPDDPTLEFPLGIANQYPEDLVSGFMDRTHVNLTGYDYSKL